jgi:hypothetical protein
MSCAMVARETVIRKWKSVRVHELELLHCLGLKVDIQSFQGAGASVWPIVKRPKRARDELASLTEKPKRRKRAAATTGGVSYELPPLPAHVPVVHGFDVGLAEFSDNEPLDECSSDHSDGSGVGGDDGSAAGSGVHLAGAPPPDPPGDGAPPPAPPAPPPAPLGRPERSYGACSKICGA